MLLLFYLSTFIPYRNLIEVLTYNHMTLLSLRSRSHVRASMALTRAGYLFIHNYIRSHIHNIFRSILMVRTGLNQYPTEGAYDALDNYS